MSIQVEQGSQAGAADGQRARDPDARRRSRSLSGRTRESVRLTGVEPLVRGPAGKPGGGARRVTLGALQGEVLAVVGPSGCGKSDAARADLRPAGASGGDRELAGAPP